MNMTYYINWLFQIKMWQLSHIFAGNATIKWREREKRKYKYNNSQLEALMKFIINFKVMDNDRTPMMP